MKVSDFDYDLPNELIAQTPLKNRAASKLLILDKIEGIIAHDHFSNIVNLLDKGDVLVLNDTSVIPARLFGEKVDTKAVIEILLLKQKEEDVWECLVKKARKIRVDTVVSFGNGSLTAKCVSVGEEGIREFKMIYDGVFYEVLDKLGEMPLPPYIHEKLIDQDRYQTVYNKYVGSAAAPTAGLHFTKELLEKIEDKGIIITFVTLHVGLGTFRPVQVDKIEDHHMHTEFYQMSKEAAKILNEAQQNHRKIIAVGTTSLRTLETVLRDNNQFIETNGWSDIFIYPGFKFKAVDSLITNFHLPKSTLLMLVSALAGKENITKAYSEAIKEKYRFFSFGDSMFIKS